MMNHPSRALPGTVALVSAIVLAAALSACGKADDTRTAGQKVDAAVASTERAAADVKADVKAAAGDVKASSQEVAAAVASTARDIAITAQVKAQLAKDPALSALRISVDTTQGRVALEGTAPSTAARAQATALAKAVEGVSAVDNRLKVEAKS